MIFRLSQKLNTKIKVGTVGALPLDENPFADWSAHLFVAARTQYIIVSNTKSLYSIVMYGKGITDDSTFIDRALSSLREFMDQDGQAFVYQRFIASASRTVRFSKALDRSVTGSMNDLIVHATTWLVEDDLSPFEIGFRLNDIPFSSLQYVNPREAIKALHVEQPTQKGPGNHVKVQLYTLEVSLLSGPIAKTFVKQHPVISRTIQIRGDQTLEDLHHAIFDAFGRWDEHMYEFQFGKGPMDSKGPRYVLPQAFEADMGEPDAPTGRVDQATIESLGLAVGRSFGYWFDFGDDWWHQINVEAIEDKVPSGKLPKVTQRVGKSPPQYAGE